MNNLRDFLLFGVPGVSGGNDPVTYLLKLLFNEDAAAPLTWVVWIVPGAGRDG